MRRTRILTAGAAAAVALLSAAAVAQVSPEVPQAPLRIQVTGVMVDAERPAKSGCIVRCNEGPRAGRGGVVMVGESACDAAVVREVRENGIVVENRATGRVEFLPLDPGRRTPAGSVQTTDGEAPAVRGPAPSLPLPSASVPDTVNVVLDRSAVTAALADLPRLLSSVLATPRFKDGPGGERTIEGYELSGIAAASLVDQIGLKNGDIAVEVNGAQLDGVQAVTRLYGQLQNDTGGTLTVLRDGRRLTIRITTK
jgi:general secretion pathway protein C